MEFCYRGRSHSPGRSPAPGVSSAGAGGIAAADADEARRHAEKARIRERILREETVDRFQLELEVRRDLVERFCQMSERKAGGPQPPPPARVTEANSSSLQVAHKQICEDDNALAASVAKQKIPVHGAPSNASLETSSKKQKLSLTCKVCGTTANSDKSMHDHLNGKGHKRKAEALSAQPTSAPKKPDLEAEEDDALSGDFKPTKFTMVTNKGTLNQVTQMDGYLLCEVCNVRTADRVTMMCHFEGTKHISKAKTRGGATGDRSIELQDTMGTWANKDMATMESCKAPGMEAANVSRGPLTVVVNTVGGSEMDMEVDGVRHPLRRVEGFLLCPCCDVKAASDIVMQSHLVGKKHKNKMKLAEAGVGGKGTSVAATLGREQGSVLKMLLAGGDAGSEAEVVSVTAPTKPTDATTEPAGKPFKIQVEGKLFTVLQGNDRRFSCEPCGVRCCNKDSMVKHLYTSTHWEKASLAEE